MIALDSDCILVRFGTGESHAVSADMIAWELAGDPGAGYDPELLRHAAKAVFHYFKHDLGLHTVTMGEFSEAFERVLQGLRLNPEEQKQEPPKKGAGRPTSVEVDLRRLAMESGHGCELIFFPLLQTELRKCMDTSPRLVRLTGLRGCVKQLIGARRWTRRCQALGDRIVWYLRENAGVYHANGEWAMVVE